MACLRPLFSIKKGIIRIPAESTRLILRRKRYDLGPGPGSGKNRPGRQDKPTFDTSRIENAAPKLYVTSNAYKIDSLVATPVVAAPILLVLLIVLMIKYRNKGSKPLISKEEEEWLKEEWG
jgi:hypothetical protein